MRFAKPPTLVGDLARARRRSSSTEDATSYTLAGTSIPGATISVELAGGTRQTSADSTGAWTMPVDVRRGRNEFKVDATDPDTGKHAEQPVEIVITVPFRRDRGADADGRPAGRRARRSRTARSPSRARRPTRTTVTITATYDGPVAGAPAPGPKSSAAPAKPAAPAAITIPVGDDGTWDTGDNPLQLTTGRWSITTTARTPRASRRRSPATSRSPTRASTSSWRSRAARPGSRSGSTARSTRPSGAPGGRIRDGQGPDVHRARTRSRSGPARRARPTSRLNGQSLGALGKRGIPETWLFQPPAAPALTQHQ